ncbi:MAG TPA: arginine repressor [Clostridia bacterium]|nr:arginine repressor [Clostridia bacterium]
MSKLSRQNLILELVQHEPLSNQEELRRRLLKHGFDVTQATLSRDIHELDLVKTSEGYSVSQGDQESEPTMPSAMRLVREFVLEIREAQNLLVVKTVPGSAQPVAVALDAESWPEVVGTVAGDDTILVISQAKKSAHKLALRIRGMLA